MLKNHRTLSVLSMTLVSVLFNTTASKAGASDAVVAFQNGKLSSKWITPVPGLFALQVQGSGGPGSFAGCQIGSYPTTSLVTIPSNGASLNFNFTLTSTVNTFDTEVLIKDKYGMVECGQFLPITKVGSIYQKQYSVALPNLFPAGDVISEIAVLTRSTGSASSTESANLFSFSLGQAALPKSTQAPTALTGF